jgi:hypothetical protein
VFTRVVRCFPFTCTRATRRENARPGQGSSGCDTTHDTTFPAVPRRLPRGKPGVEWPNSGVKLGLRHKQRQHEIGLTSSPPEVLENMVELVGIEPTTSSLRCALPLPTFDLSTAYSQTNQKTARLFKTYLGHLAKTAHTGDSHGY